MPSSHTERTLVEVKGTRNRSSHATVEFYFNKFRLEWKRQNRQGLQTSPIHSSRQSGGRKTMVKQPRSSKNEKISVSIRIRPLNSREQNSSDVYEALKSSSKTNRHRIFVKRKSSQ